MHFLNGARVSKKCLFTHEGAILKSKWKKSFYFLEDDIFLFWQDFEQKKIRSNVC